MEVVEGCGGVGEEVVVDLRLDGVGGGFAWHGCENRISMLSLKGFLPYAVLLQRGLQRRDEARGERPVAMARGAEPELSEVVRGDADLFLVFFLYDQN